MEGGYSESLSSLVTTTIKDMVEYEVGEGPRVAASIAQRVSIKEKIELSITWVVLVSVYSTSFNVFCPSVGKKSASTPKRSFSFRR